ncbi:MAG TPA: CoA-transferase [Kofleriaceae bacterium]|jgi:acyl CoA:acetate/3-ketoacid CoA transferase beta subunit/acyl CoA:acetate/3-ketoacid CoA transferase alpha subunit|nr:CoA-transferase [Kofleriaceae bacterium]
MSPPRDRDLAPARRGGLTTSLAEAIRTHITPGLHLHFASTPSRSNAAIREVARAFIDTRPGFCVSSTGFHSMAHLLPMLGLADRLIACFYGDHYPAPRPNPLYHRLAEAGVVLEHWSLWSMVASFRAGAEGEDWVINRSLRGTTIAAELAARGAYREITVPDEPFAAGPSPARTIGLCAARRPDVTFVHAACADDQGHVLMSGPLSEGMWSALAARRGVIVTVERIVPAAVTRAHPAAIALPPHRILAICEEPFGAHPQPFHAAAELGIPTYHDDFESYERWRELTTDAAGFERFVERVLRAPQGGPAYREYVGAARLAGLRVPKAPAPAAAPVVTASGPRSPSTAAVDQLIISGARQLAQRARAIDARVLIAGIGQAFFAARIAQLQLALAGFSLRVMVETGLYDVDCGPEGHGYLLAYENMANARRLSAVDDILGVLTGGADNRCIAALGAAQIDHNGNLNSTRIGGKPLIGSGGACDIAASAQEVVVMTRLAPGRLVDDVEYITSPGTAVRSVVTDRCVLVRSEERRLAGSSGQGARWTIASLAASPSTPTIALGVAALQRDCAWRLEPAADLGFAAPITGDEARLLDVLDPTGKYRHRAG